MKEAHRQAIIRGHAKRHPGQPAKSREEHAAASRERHRKRRHEINDGLREKRFRFRSRKEGDPPIPGDAIVPGRLLNAPQLLYLDTAGVLHVEQELSAEELIKRWKKTQQPPRRQRRQRPPSRNARDVAT